jgi:hypothetical protein
MAQVPRSLEFQYGATLQDVDNEQRAVVTNRYYGEDYVWPGPESGPIPKGVDASRLGNPYGVAPTKT